MMEAPLEEAQTPDSHELKASEEAIAFTASIELTELQKCVFSDSLETVSEGGQALGQFNLTVEFARWRLQRPCLLVHAQSQGAIDDCPCGTTVTAYLTTELEVLQEDYHEYVKLKGHSLDKRFHMEQRDGKMVIDKVSTVGEEVTKENISYPMSELRGLVTEGSNLLLMRLMARRRKVPEHMNFISLDQSLQIIHTTFSELGIKRMEVGGVMMDIFGVERTVHSVVDSPTTWQCYFQADGFLVSRVQMGSPVTMRLLQLPPPKIPLAWEEDMQMHSKFLDRKEELKADHSYYLRQHPEIRALVSDFLQFLLLRKPDDVYQFARQYFLSFARPHSPEANL